MGTTNFETLAHDFVFWVEFWTKSLDSPVCQSNLGSFVGGGISVLIFP